MLKLSTSLKRVPFQLEDKGTVHNLYVTQYSVEDANHLLELQRPLVNVENDQMTYESFIITRIMAGVKHDKTDERFWDCTIEEFKKNSYPNQLLNELVKVINELNPLPDLSKLADDETLLDQKKSKS